MAVDYSKLITEDGNVDVRYMREIAVLRATGPYGASPRAIRSEFLNLKQIVHAERLRWRQAHGLPDDTVYVTVTAYGKHHDGVRREMF